jgi:A/G-specific adenine glycosylase
VSGGDERLAAAARDLVAWYERSGRNLPWRTDRAPYRVVVSEFMLQQTQVDRVVPIFERFVAAFPSFAALAAASPGAVVRAWQGLGYNARAVRLHALARAVVERHGGELPREQDALRALPGVGPYTAGAIRAFAFDERDAAPDVNVRRVVERAFFGAAPGAAARDIDAAAARLAQHGGGNAINSALMDLGATLCKARAAKCLVCPLYAHCASAPLGVTRAPRATRAPRYEDTTRYLRGRIVDALRALGPSEALSLRGLYGRVSALVPGRTIDDVTDAAAALAREGLVAFDGRQIALEQESLIGF